MTSSTSYDNAPRASDHVSLVRMMLGGNEGAAPLFTNTEIEVVLELAPVPTYAAAALWEMAAAKWSAGVDQSIGATSISLSQKISAAMDMAKRLREGGPGLIPGGDGSGTPTAEMIVGGISRSEKEAFLDDSDRIQPNFSLGQDDNPYSDSGDSDPNLNGWEY
jgi:hypothetical protein